MLASSCSKYKYETVSGDPLKTRIYTLPNGLKVYMSVMKEQPRIQTAIAVRVGGKNDPAETTGLAHYFEHLMFKGTEKFGTSDYAAEKPMLDEIERLFEVYRKTTDEAERAAIYHRIDSISYEASKIAIPNEYDKLMAAIGANVSHNAVATFVHAKLLAQVGDGSVNMAQQCSVRFGKLCRRFNMLLGDHQKMHRCLRVNIIKCQQSVILIQLIGRDLARCDFAKQAVIHRFCPLSQGSGRLARHPKIVQLYYSTLSLLFPGFLSQCLPQRSVHRRSWKYRGYRPWRSPACRRRCRLQWQRSA